MVKRELNPHPDQDPNWFTSTPRTVVKPGRSRLTVRFEDDGSANVLGSMQPYARVVVKGPDYLVIGVPNGAGEVVQVYKVDKQLSAIHMSCTFLLEYTA